MRRLAEILVLSALAEWAQGRHREARESAARALATAEAMGCIRVFVDEGSRMKHLIAAAARMLPAHLHPFAAKVIDAFDDAGTAAHAAPARPLAPRADAGDPPIESLTPREREVLFLLATGCSNRDIAAQLTITLHAVKKHTGNIYAKLGAANRTHALILAQELGILPR
jgi:ATP/maltotriose-dependent transcriptional regulator MalT